MDIIDIMLARAMTPQGQTDIYVSKANKAAAKAEKAEQDAAEAIATVEAAADEIAAAKKEANDLLEAAQDALETAQQAAINMPEVYHTTGQNVDGYMTQKAVTDALATKADTTTLNIYVTTTTMNTALANKADKSYVDQQIANIPSSGGSGSGSGSNINLDFGSDNEGRIVIVDEEGHPISGTVTEEDIIQALITNGGYAARDAVGLEIDYENKSFTRTQQAVGKVMGSDFDSYTMYGGRRRCIVDDNGEIAAFYGENGYNEEYSNHQVMIYQPKFYYQRIPLQTEGNRVGKIINKDSIIISPTPQSGFKVHPLFINADGEEVDYVLLGAYEGSIYKTVAQSTYNFVITDIDFNTDKLASNANTKPITGTSNLTLQRAEQLANNRGTGWHIFNLQAESANQMLEIVEFGSLNGQSVLGKGVSQLTSQGSYNQSALTGSTYSLGNGSGMATSTIIETNDKYTTETENGKVSISYRGLENPWGNTWTMLGGILIYGNSVSNGGIPYICKNYNYSYTALTNNYESAGFSLPNSSGWVAAFGYGDKKYDWLFMPAAVGGNANSALPVGDNSWFDANLSGLRMVAHGGGWTFEDSDGPFYYACDHAPNDSTYRSYGTRLMFIPTKNNVYLNNIAKWQAEMNKGG